MIIGLTGRPGAGKDTFARYLISEAAFRGRTLVRLSFGDELKDELAAALRISVNELNNRKHFFRRLLQYWATDFRREHCGQDYWIRKVEPKIQYALTHGAHGVVLTDVRFPNELKLIEHYCGVLCRIRRDTRWQDFKHRLFNKEHVAEKFWRVADCDFEINNTGHEALMYDQGKQVLNKIFGHVTP